MLFGGQVLMALGMLLGHEELSCALHRQQMFDSVEEGMSLPEVEKLLNEEPEVWIVGNTLFATFRSSLVDITFDREGRVGSKMRLVRRRIDMTSH